MRNVVSRFVHRPRQVWLRRALFQVHLWAGLVVGLYMIVIGVSGSILVFREQLEARGRPAEVQARARTADLLAVTEALRAAHPRGHVQLVLAPTPARPVFRAWVEEGGHVLVLDAGAETGTVLKDNPWQRALAWIADLHVNLLAGGPGLIANGIGAACLVLLAVSGLVIWWPGIRGWKRALGVNFRRNWKRINFDLHSATGFWPLGLIAFWGISGIYFAWPAQFVSAVKRMVPVVAAQAPKYKVTPGRPGQSADLAAVLAQAHQLAPWATLAGIAPSNAPAQPIIIDMARERPGDLLNTDYLYFHPATGQHLATWHYGANQTAGDWFLWLMHPLHFGTSWGLAVKIAWAALGMVLPLLTVTGALMYWNRYLGPRVRRRPARESRHGNRRLLKTAATR